MVPERVEICWGVGQIGDGIGNAYGYTVHNNTLHKYTEQIATLDVNARNVVWIISPEIFKPEPDRINWLFTMFEGLTLPDRYLPNIDKADYLLTPSTWVKELFQEYFPHKQIFVVSHGVEPIFKFKKRKFPNTKPFRYLWVGAPNPRKGWEEIIHLWKYAFQNRSEVELYLKTTRIKGVERNGNVILDGRNLSVAELVALYHSSHAFVFPTRGEGFGLTLAEAMRTGLPCVSTYYSGVTDFFDGIVGYPLNYTIIDAEVTFIGDKTKAETKIATPNLDELLEAMVEIYTNYKAALKKAELAYKRISTRFTWERSAQTLVNLIKEYGYES